MQDLYIITHVYNEKLMLEPWIKHHYDIADKIIILDSNTTDDSLDIVKKYPKCEIVKSKIPDFSAWGNTQECMALEASLPADAFKIILNVTEWIWHPNFKEFIIKDFNSYNYPIAIGMKSIIMVDTQPEIDLCNKSPYGFVDYRQEHRRWRFVHNAKYGQYEIGRHGTTLPTLLRDDMFILWLGFFPYPQCKERKLQIQTQIPQADKNVRLGWEHIINSEELDQRHQEFVIKSNNLMFNDDFIRGFNFYSKESFPFAKYSEAY